MNCGHPETALTYYCGSCMEEERAEIERRVAERTRKLREALHRMVQGYEIMHYRDCDSRRARGPCSCGLTLLHAKVAKLLAKEASDE